MSEKAGEAETARKERALDEAIEKKLLGKIYVHSLSPEEAENELRKKQSFEENLCNALNLSSLTLSSFLHKMQEEGLVTADKVSSSLRITEKGRKKIVVVMAGGTFDIIHPGHIQTLKEAKSLGDVLIVSVARNSTYRKNKGKNSIHDERLRCDLVSSIRYVDCALLGSESNIFETVRLLKPDIIALGYDQFHTENGIKEGSERVGVKVTVVRLHSEVSNVKTSKIMSGEKRETLLRET